MSMHSQETGARIKYSLPRGFPIGFCAARRSVGPLAKASASRQQISGADILGFLRTFEGAAATFTQEDGHWSLWLPEFSPDGHPLTPASQIFFPVILRHDAQAFAIRFFYDCATGKVRYYTSAIPDEIARLPELENAISELFRHSLPIEAIRQRNFAPKNHRASLEPPLPPPIRRKSLADPDDRSIPPVIEPEPAAKAPPPAMPRPIREERAPVTREQRIILPPPRPAAALVPAPPVQSVSTPARALAEVAPAGPPSRPREVTRNVRIELGPRARTVLIVIVVTLGIALLGVAGAYVYVQATQDPGIEHHRLQIEEMRLRNGG